MRRLARHVFNVLCALSLLLCVATGAMWVRSLWVEDELASSNRVADVGDNRTKTRVHTLTSTRGTLEWTFGTVLAAWPEQFLWRRRPLYGDNPVLANQLIGFRIQGLSGAIRLCVPYWPAVVLCALPTALAVRARRRQSRRHLAGLCPVCGYDLRASPGRCPECGAAAAAGGPRDSL